MATLHVQDMGTKASYKNQQLRQHNHKQNQNVTN